MNEKLYKEEFRNILKREYGMSEKSAADALNKFFGLLVKALEEERYVKIKGLGIFKLIDVESRKSVNVNTGESIEIPEHRKISFSVDSKLKELINKPFAHFEAVELKDENLLVETEKEEDVFPQSEVAEVEEVPWESSVESVEVHAEEECVEKSGDAGRADTDASETKTGEQDWAKEDKSGSEGESVSLVDNSSEGKEQMKAVTRREGLRRLEKELEKEERSNKIALFTISIFMFLLMLMGMLFVLAPEFLERLFY